MADRYDPAAPPPNPEAAISLGGEPAKNSEPVDVDPDQQTVTRLIQNAVNFIDGEIASDRDKATDYYLGKPFGNEEDGRSQVVITEVRDTVNMMMPDLMRLFWGPERVVEFRPRNAEDVEGAEQATDYIADIVLKEDNPGYREFWSAFKDALVRKTGVWKWWWDDKETTTSHNATGLTEEAIELLAADNSITLVSKTPRAFIPSPGDPALLPPPQPGMPAQIPPAQPVTLWDVEFTRTRTEGVARFMALPPEEFLIDREARSIEDALIVAHRTLKMRGDLIAMGIPKDVLDAVGTAPSGVSVLNTEEQTRNPYATGRGSEAVDPSTVPIPYVEAYVYLEAKDGTGRTELRKVCTVGHEYRIVENEGVDERPFAVLCPNPEPHMLIGLCPADETMDLQLAESSVTRSMLDSLALSIFPRTEVVEGEVNQDDIENTEIGAAIRVSAIGMAKPWTHEFVGKEAFPVLDFFQAVKERRVGVAPLDADALQSSTEVGVAATLTQAQQRMEVIARNFAEGGIRELMRGLLRLTCKHQTPGRIVRLRNKFVPIDPRTWNATMDVSINIALGGGLTSKKIETLQMVAEKQEQILQTLGPQNPLVTFAQYRYTLGKILELTGWKNTSQFFQEVDPSYQPPPPQPGTDPAAVAAQVEQVKAQAHVAKAQADIQIAHTKAQSDMANESQKLALQREEMYMVDQRERDRMSMEMALREKEMQLRYASQANSAQLNADAARDKAVLNAHSAVAVEHVRQSAAPEDDTGE